MAHFTPFYWVLIVILILNHAYCNVLELNRKLELDASEFLFQVHPGRPILPNGHLYDNISTKTRSYPSIERGRWISSVSSSSSVQHCQESCSLWIVFTIQDVTAHQLATSRAIESYSKEKKRVCVVIAADVDDIGNWQSELPQANNKTVFWLDRRANDVIGAHFSFVRSTPMGINNLAYLFAIWKCATAIWTVDYSSDWEPPSAEIWRLWEAIQTANPTSADYSMAFPFLEPTPHDIANPLAFLPADHECLPFGSNVSPKTANLSHHVAVEKRPLSSVGVVHSLHSLRSIRCLSGQGLGLQPRKSPRVPVVALPGGAFAPMIAHGSLFLRLALWSLFVPTISSSRSLLAASVLKAFVAQRLFWECHVHELVDLTSAPPPTSSFSDADSSLLQETNAYFAAVAMTLKRIDFSAVEEDVGGHDSWRLFKKLEMAYIALYEHGLVEIETVRELQGWLSVLASTQYAPPQTLAAAPLAVIGFLTTSHMRAEHHLMRSSWLRHLIYANVRYAFLFDAQENATMAADIAAYGDVLILNTTFQGKSNHFGEKVDRYFDWAVRQFPTAQIVIKADDDLFLCAHAMVARLRHLLHSPAHSSLYFGWEHNPSTSSHSAASATHRMDELFVAVAMPLVKSMMQRPYCAFATDCPVGGRVDHNAGGTSIGSWLQPLNVTFVQGNADFHDYHHLRGAPHVMPVRVDFCLDRYLLAHKADSSTYRIIYGMDTPLPAH